MSVSLKKENNCLTAYIEGEIDHHTAVGIRSKIDEKIQRDKPSKLILDYSDVTFMDSSGIGLIMGRYRMMQGISGQIEVNNVPKNFYKVVKISGIEKLGKVTVKEELT